MSTPVHYQFYEILAPRSQFDGYYMGMKGMNRMGAAIGVSLALCATALAQQVGTGGNFPPPSSGTWKRTTNHTSVGLGHSLLLTDGTVIVQHPDAGDWWKLTPDSSGSYLNGTWSQIASLPSGYGPLYFGSAVLNDGRVVIIGGEYNFGSQVWTNRAAVYDPLTNKWASLGAPSGWSQIGDCQTVVMPNGRFVIADPFDTRMASLNPATLAWTSLAGTGKGDRFDEEGWNMMPEGTVLTADALNAPHAEKYVPSLDRWISAGNTPQSLEDPGSQEVGPAVLRPNGTVFYMGATGHNAVYTPGNVNTDPGTWVKAPDFPNIGGQLDIADGPACLLPDGNVLCVASPGVFNAPSHFFEFDGTNLAQVNAVPNSASNPSYIGTLLMLPTGQVLYTDFTADAEIYTPTGTFQDAWRPTVTAAPGAVVPGGTFALTGTQFNGLSECTAYGDDSTNSTNYPLVRVTNNATGHVKYLRTHDHSTRAVATGATSVTTNVDVPSVIEAGPSTMVVVANGIPSVPRAVNVLAAGVTLPTSFTVIDGTQTGGNLASLLFVDTNYLTVTRGNATPPILIQASGTSATLNPATFQFLLRSSVTTSGLTQTISLYNFTTNAYEVVDTRAGTTTDQTATITPTGTLKRFVNASTGEVRVQVGYGVNSATTAKGWSVNIDLLNWNIK